MSSHRIVGAPSNDAAQPSGEMVPFYVCGGARETPMGYTLFPYGGTYEVMTVCPAREICAWYAAHDLGGTVEYSDQPPARIIAAAFRTAPFACPHFRDYEKLLREQRKARKKGKRNNSHGVPPGPDQPGAAP